MVLCVLEDEPDDELYVSKTGGIVRSDVSAPTCVQAVLKPAELDGIELPSANAVQEAEGLQTDPMATKLKLGESTHSLT